MPPAKRKRGASSRPANATTIVVGLDFGTTYSGIAWARSTRPEHIHMVSAWGGLAYYQASDKEKAPSVLSYNSEGQVTTWGYGFAPPEEPVKWFKLLLLDEEDLTEELRKSDELMQAKAILKRHNKEPVEVTGEYLSRLWSHSLTQIRKSMGQQFVDSCILKIVATLPAIWPPYAQIRMREAIQISGMLDERSHGVPNLTFLSEPEAAALASLHDIVDRHDIKKDDHYVVCDAGGGTVDLITYAISSGQPIVVKESVAGHGALCGAILLDKAFKNTFRNIVGPETWATTDPRVLHFVVTVEWENGMKCTFSGDPSPWQFVSPFGATIDGSLPSIEFQAKNLIDIFASPVAQISKLINQQIEAVFETYGRMPKAVILVGGLGRSPFLYQHLEKRFSGIEIIQNGRNRPWTAVARGAVIKGLSDSGCSNSFQIGVGSRISRANYGTLLNVFPFEEGKDDPRDRLWCEVQQDFLSVNQVDWFLKMGTVMEETSVVKSFWQDFSEPSQDIDIELVYSTNQNPSKRCDDTVTQLCRIKWSKIPKFDSLPEWRNPNGTLFRKITYDIKMTVVGSSLDFAIYHKGRRMGSQNVAVEFGQRVVPKTESAQPSMGTPPTIGATAADADRPMAGNSLTPGEDSGSEWEF